MLIASELLLNVLHTRETEPLAHPLHFDAILPYVFGITNNGLLAQFNPVVIHLLKSLIVYAQEMVFDFGDGYRLVGQQIVQLAVRKLIVDLQLFGRVQLAKQFLIAFRR